MYVSASMVSIINQGVSYLVWVMLSIAFDVENLREISAYATISFIIKLILSYSACIQVSIEQTSKTMKKLRQASELNNNG